MPSREERLAANEARFRDINQAAQPLRETGGGGRFVCECADRSCTAWIEMTRDEYHRLRENPLHFAIKPSHEILDVESIIGRFERYFVVEKPKDVAHVVEPRSA
ncbi:MAG: hypothetical protein ACJ77Z_19840 [Thermoleophilaceae bacterium]